jgi:hypothetical protein
MSLNQSKNNDNAKSIDLGEESDDQEEREELTEVERKEREEARREDGEKHVAYWNINDKTRAHAVQMILSLGNNLGHYIDDEFKKGVFACKNVIGFREYIVHKDDKQTREMMIYISSLNMMKTLMVPLFEHSEDDSELIYHLLRLFMAMTRELTEAKQLAVVNRVREKPVAKELKPAFLKRIREEKQFQKNGYDQLDSLLTFKEALITEEVFRVIYQYVDGPVSKASKNRTLDDKKCIEAVLHLIINLLGIQAGPFSLSAELIRSRDLQNKLILLLAKKDFFDLFQLLCATVNEKENTHWNKMLVEIMHHLVW